jgi:hypothetical protein
MPVPSCIAPRADWLPRMILKARQNLGATAYTFAHSATRAAATPIPPGCMLSLLPGKIFRPERLSLLSDATLA